MFLLLSCFSPLARYLSALQGRSPVHGFALRCFLSASGFVALIDKLVPDYENPHEMHNVEELKDEDKASRFRKLYRVGILTAVVISIHNFPEGVVTFLSSMTDLKLGLVIAIAIAIHNIPEGIAVSIPIFYATGSRKKAFVYSFLSGLAEPLGGIIGYFILKPFINNEGNWNGIRPDCRGDGVYFLRQPVALGREYGQHHLAILGLVIGMIVMAVSLLLF